MEFRLLGPVEVRTDSGRVELGPQQARCLLAVLLLEPGVPVPAQSVVQRVWDGDPPASARHTLHKYVASLRRVIGGAGAAGQFALEHRPGGYVLGVERDRIDVHRFVRLTREARAAAESGDHQRCVELLDAALALWRGVPLADLNGSWAERTRHRLREDQLRAVIDRVEAKLALGLHAELIGELSSLVDEHPFNETLIGQLMRALYRHGRALDAAECYRSAYQRFIEEAGNEPGDELKDLHQQILSGDSALLYRPAPEVRLDTAPLYPEPSRPRQLPADVTRFTGRERYLAQLDGLLPDGTGQSSGAVVISAIAGTAGVGKTALAVHWAHRVAERFPDGQLYVNLRGHSPGLAPLTPAESLPRLLRALGVAPARIPAEPDEQASMYRDRLAGRKILVLLDNAHDAEQVRPLLPGSPSCLAVITCRDRLDGLAALHDVHRVVLDVLSGAESVSLLTQILGVERVSAERTAVEDLVRLCAHLPLALRIAAAYLDNRPHHTIARYVARLRDGDRLAALATSPDRQTGVSAAFDLSYASLPAGTRRLFRRLGLSPGPGFTPDTAAHLADVPLSQAELLLDTLAAAHLVVHYGPEHYRFHDLLRLYATHRAETEDSAEEREAALRRLFDFYLHTTENAAALLRPGFDRLPRNPPMDGVRPLTFDTISAALSWLDAERLNLVAATTHAAEHGHRPFAWHLADALRSYFASRRHTVDWIATGRAGFNAAIHARDTTAQAAMHRTLGHAHWSISNHRQMNSHLTRWLSIHRRSGDLPGEANALLYLGILSNELGQLDKAAEYNSRTLDLLEKSGSPPSAAALNNLAHVYQEMGRLEEANEKATAALVRYRADDDKAGYAAALETLGRIHRDAGRYPDALSALESALLIVRQAGDHSNDAHIVNTLGTVHRCLGHHRDAVDHHTQALDNATRTNNELAKADALLGLATAQCEMGSHGTALANADRGLAITRAHGFAACEARLLTTLARVHHRLGDDDQAATLAEQALEIHRRTGQRLDAARTLVVLGHATGETARWHDALAIADDVGAPEATEVRSLLDRAADTDGTSDTIDTIDTIDTTETTETTDTTETGGVAAP